MNCKNGGIINLNVLEKILVKEKHNIVSVK